jgi:hypothetical protein
MSDRTSSCEVEEESPPDMIHETLKMFNDDGNILFRKQIRKGMIRGVSGYRVT